MFIAKRRTLVVYNEVSGSISVRTNLGKNICEFVRLWVCSGLELYLLL